MLTFWDIAAGIVVATFLIAPIIRGLNNPKHQGPALAAIFAACLLVLYRTACWHGDLRCEVEPHQPSLAELQAKYGLDLSTPGHQ